MPARRRVRPKAARCLVPAVLASTVVAGCTPADPDPPRAELSVSVSQPRPDEGTRILRGAVVNDGDTTVEITSVRLAWPGLPSKPVAVDEEVAAGAIAGFTLEHGSARCRDVASEPPSVAVAVDGAEVLVPLAADDAATVHRLHERACAAQRLQRVARVELHLADRASSGRLPGRVVVRRRTGASTPVTVVDVAGSVLLRLAPQEAPQESRLPARLGPDDRRLVLPVQLTSTRRCDAHAVTNSSQTFLLSIYLRLGRGAEQRVIAFPEPGPRRALVRLMEQACGAPPGP